MSEDFMLISRGGVDYKCTLSNIQDYLVGTTYEVVCVSDPIIDPGYVEINGKAYGKLAEFKLQKVTNREAPDPVYEYSWFYEFNGGRESLPDWQIYDGQPNDVTFDYQNGMEKIFLRCKYTYDGATETCESNRAPVNPKPEYINTYEYLANTFPTITKSSYRQYWVEAQFTDSSGEEWVYIDLRFDAPDQDKDGLYRTKRSTFEYDKYGDNFEKVLDYDPNIFNPAKPGKYTVLTESIFLKNSMSDYFLSIDTGKTWNSVGMIFDPAQEALKLNISAVIAQLSPTTWKVMFGGQIERHSQIGILEVVGNDIKVEVFNDPSQEWGYFWHYNHHGSSRAVPDSNGYYFGLSEDKSTYYRWTDPTWSTTPEEMAMPAFPDSYPNSSPTMLDTYWDGLINEYIVSVEFKENGTNTVLGSHIYKFAWGDSTMTRHGFDNVIAKPFSKYDYWAKVIANGKAVGWAIYVRNRNYHWMYDADGYKNNWICMKPDEIYVGCNMNFHQYQDGGSFILNQAGYCKS